MTETMPCAVAGCTSKSPRRINGVCQMHDQRMRSTGSYGPPGRLRREPSQTCRVEGCDRHAERVGLCPSHRRREMLYGAPDGRPAPREHRVCAVHGCDARHFAKSYCRKHYRRWVANGSPDLRTHTFEERFWAQVDRRGDDECWPWTGATVKGYGHSHENYVHYYAHRRSYEIAHDVVLASDVVVRHMCDNPPCVNPAHLVTGTQHDNVQDMVERGRGWWQKHPREAIEAGVSLPRVAS